MSIKHSVAQIDWNDLPKEIGKFYISIALFYLIIFLIMWVYGIIILESYKIEPTDYLAEYEQTSDAPRPYLLPIPYWIKYVAFFFAGLVSLYGRAVYGIPHLTIFICTIYAINSLFIRQASLLEYAYTYTALTLLISAAAISCISIKFLRNKTKQRPSAF